MQSELNFAPAPPADAEVARLVEFLRMRPDWHKAKEIAAALGLPDRKVRQLAENSAGQIVSAPGSPGYRHLSHCTADEISHAANQLHSQGKRMIDRSIRLRRAAHGALH